MNLRTKLLTPLGLVGVLAAGYLQFVALPDATRASELRMHRALVQQLDHFAESLAAPLRDGALAAVRAQLDVVLAARSDWLSVEVFDLSGHSMLYLGAPRWRGAMRPAEEDMRPPYNYERFAHELSSRVHTHLQPVYDDVGPMGALVLSVDMAAQYEALRDAYQRFTLVLVAALVGALVLVGLFLEPLVIRPVGGLLRAAERMSAHDFGAPLPKERRDELGRLTRTFAAMRDAVAGHERALNQEVAERKRAEAQAREAERAAEEASAAKSQFLARMSHEIRTPLNGILGMTELLGGADLPQAQRKLVAAAHRSGESLLEIVDDILDLTRVEAGRLRLVKADFDLPGVISEAVELLMADARRKDLVLEADIAPDVPTWVRGDAGRLRQVLVNLLSNAVKFTDSGRVTVACAPCGAREDGALTLRFAVEDTGCGLAPELRARVFEVFVQGDESARRRFGGTGLGLAIVRQLVRLMGGEVGVESAPGRGSRFWFTVSLEPGTGDGAEAQAAPARVEPLDARVLVVEDNPVNEWVAVGLLGALGCRAEVARNGADAVAAFRSGGFDVILMDCEMPGMDGFEATAEIRRIEATSGAANEIPIIAVTAHAFQGYRERCLGAGMNAYLSKPIHKAALRAALARELDGRAPA